MQLLSVWCGGESWGNVCGVAEVSMDILKRIWCELKSNWSGCEVRVDLRFFGMKVCGFWGLCWNTEEFLWYQRRVESQIEVLQQCLKQSNFFYVEIQWNLFNIEIQKIFSTMKNSQLSFIWTVYSLELCFKVCRIFGHWNTVDLIQCRNAFSKYIKNSKSNVFWELMLYLINRLFWRTFDALKLFCLSLCHILSQTWTELSCFNWISWLFNLFKEILL